MHTFVDITLTTVPPYYKHRAPQHRASCRFNFGEVGNLGEVSGTLSETAWTPEAAVAGAVSRIEAMHPNHTFLFARYDE
ncbi:MAG: hypothetical protein WC736_15180 [Gallionella sp.]|jgi:hypothetical protein